MSCVCRGGSPSWIPQDQSSDCGVLSPSSLYELFLWGQFGVCWLDLLAIDLASRLWLCWWLGFKLREKLSLWRLRWCAYTFFKKKKHKKYHTHKKALYREPLCCTRFAKAHTHKHKHSLGKPSVLFKELYSIQGTFSLPTSNHAGVNPMWGTWQAWMCHIATLRIFFVKKYMYVKSCFNGLQCGHHILSPWNLCILK